MVYEEINKDLFEYIGEDVKFVQCVSADLAMGAGIAVQFNKHFDTKNKAIAKYGEKPLRDWDSCFPAQCIDVDEVFCLVTKRNYWNKPTKQTMAQALMGLKSCCGGKCKHLVMPRIGAGLDKLPWKETKEQIMSMFDDTDIHITVCVR